MPRERRGRGDRVGRPDDRAEHERRLPAHPRHDRVGDDRDGRHRREHEADREQRERPHLGLELARRRVPAGRVQQRREEDEEHDVGIELEVGQRRDEPIASPPSTSTIGYGTEIRSASRTSTAAAASSRIRNSMSPTARGTLGSRPVPDVLTPPLGADDHVDGPADAPLELVMYGDFQCPFCTAAQPILRRVRDRLDGRLRFAFRHFPLRALHPDAERAAQASEAAAAQGAFWAMHDALYAPARAARRRRRRGGGAADRARRRADPRGAGGRARTRQRCRPTSRAARPAA